MAEAAYAEAALGRETLPDTLPTTVAAAKMPMNIG